MKKNLLYLLIFVVLLALAGWLLSERNTVSSLRGQDNYDFAIKDTAALTRIVLSDKTPFRSELIRTVDGWLLDGEYPVRNDAIETLMETIYKMEMRNFVEARMKPTVLRNLDVYGKQVEFYAGRRKVKSMVVGPPTNDELGSWMMLEGGDAPYAVHIPGFNGFLTSRFITEPHLWRRRDLARMNPYRLKEVKVTYPDSVQASFTIRLFSRDSIYVLDSRGQRLPDINKATTFLYLQNFKNLRYEAEIIPSDGIYARRDSLLASTPVFRVDLRSIDGQQHSFEGYRIKAARQTIDVDNPNTFYDNDRLHGFINRDRMVLLQYYGLRNVLVKKEYFRQSIQPL